MTEQAASQVGLRRRRINIDQSPENLTISRGQGDLERSNPQTPRAHPIEGGGSVARGTVGSGLAFPIRELMAVQPPGGERNTQRRAGSRQRRQQQQEEEEQQHQNNHQHMGNLRIPRGNAEGPPSDHPEGFSAFGVSQIYFFASTLLALMAILCAPSNMALYATTAGVPAEVSSTSNPLSAKPAGWSSHVEQVGKAAAAGFAARRVGQDDSETRDILQSIQQWWNIHSSFAQTKNQNKHQNNKKPHHTGKEWNGPPPSDQSPESPSHEWVSWLRLHFSQKGRATKKALSKLAERASTYSEPSKGVWTAPEYLWNWIDPTILQPSSSTTTDIIDKILTSTGRLLAISNFMLAMTYLLHSAVATWFLGDHQHFGFSPMTTGNPRGPGGIGNSANMAADFSNPARERMGGFLVFKLLLISAVVAPDTLDLLILLTWYTILSCMRSLDHLAHSTTLHLSALGQSPRSGVMHLLFLVLGCNILAAASCVALFHAAGWGMVLLLTCDCALLAVDVLSHVIKHFTCVLEDVHSQATASMEGRQLELHNHHPPPRVASSTIIPQNTSQHNTVDETENIASSLDEIIDGIGRVGRREEPIDTERERSSEMEEHMENDDGHPIGVAGESSTFEILQESRDLDRQMEAMDLAHARRLGIMDNAMFALELLCHLLTVAHFCHIWSLHGVQFTLIDGVLALHLHSAISSACRKIAQRRNIHSIARDLQDLFPNASEQELRKASQAGDVCCICLGTMSTGGHVKKVPCGHLYHTHCLREVVERAQSIQAAKCPLCRASLLDGSRPEVEVTTTNLQGNLPTNAVAGVPPLTNQAPMSPQAQQQLQAQQQQQPQRALPNGGVEHALFRFSTEGILPAWMPVPAFSFEVVRRPSGMGPGIPPAGQLGAAPSDAVPNTDSQQQQQQLQPADRDDLADRTMTGVENPAPGIAAGGQQAATTPNAQADSASQRVPQDAPASAAPQVQEAPQSFLRRMLILAGAIPMSPEEEARALNQLVDMFPQYERLHLQRELRSRGSAEAVAEAILMGVFVSGVPRGGGS